MIEKKRPTKVEEAKGKVGLLQECKCNGDSKSQKMRSEKRVILGSRADSKYKEANK